MIKSILKAYHDKKLADDVSALRRAHDEAPFSEVIYKRIWESRNFSILSPRILSFLQQRNYALPAFSNLEIMAYQYANDWHISTPLNSDSLSLWLQQNQDNYQLNSLRNAKSYKELLNHYNPGTNLLRGGINLIGYFNSKSGLGEDSRLVGNALELAGIRVNRIYLPHISDEGFDRKQPERYLGKNVFATNLLCVSPLQLNNLKTRYPELFGHTYNIAMLAWELPLWPNHEDNINWLDEIWGVSEFCTTAFKSVDTKRYYLPSPVDAIQCTNKINIKAKGTLNVLTIFDAASQLSRKNPEATIRAFKEAFIDEGIPANLTIKVINLSADGRDLLESYIAGDQRITIIDHNLSAKALSELYMSADVYISLHRSEGLGRTIAEAICSKTPVIITNWSGSQELLTHDYPFLVKSALVPATDYPFCKDQHWAEPDIDHAAAHLREIAKLTEPELNKIIQKQLTHIYSSRSLDTTGALYKQRLNDII